MLLQAMEVSCLFHVRMTGQACRTWKNEVSTWTGKATALFNVSHTPSLGKAVASMDIEGQLHNSPPVLY